MIEQWLYKRSNQIEQKEASSYPRFKNYSLTHQYLQTDLIRIKTLIRLPGTKTFEMFV